MEKKWFKIGSVDNCSTNFTRPTFRGLSAESIDPADKPRGVVLELNCQQTLYFKVFITLLVFTFSPLITATDLPNNVYHRDFWAPTYHVERLNYCLIDGKTCGKKVAARYCNLMGYQEASRATIEYNVGLTHYLHTNSACRGWRCHGFQLIECQNKIIHKPVAPYYHRLKKYVMPRMNHYRVDWCLEKGKQCGHPAAYSFCRRLGYMKDNSFSKGEAAPATKTVGTQELCFGQQCTGFKEITCFR